MLHQTDSGNDKSECKTESHVIGLELDQAVLDRFYVSLSVPMILELDFHRLCADVFSHLRSSVTILTCLFHAYGTILVVKAESPKLIQGIAVLSATTIASLGT